MSLWDAHVHLFPQRLFQAIWRWFEGVDWVLPYKKFTSEELADLLPQHGIEKAYHLTYAHKPDMSSELNAWTREFAAQRPWLIPFAAVHPLDRDGRRELKEALDRWNFSGVKLQLSVQKMAADDPRLDWIYQMVEERGKLLVVHATTAPMPDANLGLSHLEPVLQAHPGLKVQLPHLGYYEFREAVECLPKYPNLYLDTSWALGNPRVEVDRDFLCRALEKYPERFLYGSDFPITEEHLLAGLNYLESLGLQPRTLELIVQKNAQKLVEG